MKKLFAALKELSLKGEYTDYRLIITPYKVELKLRPSRRSKLEEVNYIVDNDKDSIRMLSYNILK